MGIVCLFLFQWVLVSLFSVVLEFLERKFISSIEKREKKEKRSTRELKRVWKLSFHSVHSLIYVTFIEHLL